MIDSLLNLMFRCSHRRLTRPVTPVARAGTPHGETYVVCLDCGKQFAYDVKEMQIGKALPKSPDSGVLPPDPPLSAGRGVKYALWVSVPLALAAGFILREKKPGTPQPEKKSEKSEKTEARPPKTEG